MKLQTVRCQLAHRQTEIMVALHREKPPECQVVDSEDRGRFQTRILADVNRRQTRVPVVGVHHVGHPLPIEFS